jgi:hypothetical protein
MEKNKYIFVWIQPCLTIVEDLGLDISDEVENI